MMKISRSICNEAWQQQKAKQPTVFTAKHPTVTAGVFMTMK
jgi:hypothetical protein